MGVVVACKNEKDPKNNDGTGVVSTFLPYKYMGIFPDAQGQLTHKSLLGSCRISNSSKLLRLFLLHDRMKKIQSKCRRYSGHNIIHHFLRRSRALNNRESCSAP